MVEVPDTGILADYISVDKMKKHIHSAVTLAESTDVYASIGFHFQGTSNYEKILKVVQHITKTYDNSDLEFTTVQDVASRV